MTVLGKEAWITSAVNARSVSKALVLAGSLRRVHTGKKLVVVTTFGVAPELREKLKDVFDLVVLIEQDGPHEGILEDYAKVEGFSLLIFTKCVYISPNAVVLRNCDEIFDKYGEFAVTGGGEIGMKNSDVFLFTPNSEMGKALREYMHREETRPIIGDFKGVSTSPFNNWIVNSIPKMEKLGEEYNTIFKLKDESSNSKSVSSSISIANFAEMHPLDLSDEKLHGLGSTEKFLVDLCRQLQRKGVRECDTPNVYTELSLEFDVYKKEPIAIVGMSVRLPGAKNIDEFWKLLLDGKDGVIPVPPSRWRREHTIWPPQNMKVQTGFLTVPVDEFEPEFFGITEQEAELLDPQSRLLHEVTWEALEDAMVDPRTLQGTKTGVFVGSWLQDYKDMVNISTGGKDFAPTYMRSSVSAGAAGLSRFLKVKGPTVGTESGCSAGIVAMDLACKSLQNRESNMALACGVNLLLHPFDYSTLTMVLSQDGRCRTFDEGADGFGRAEVCVVLLMKRYSDAVRDEDKIWGLVRGFGVTQEGVSKSFGTPTVHCESLAMELALKDAGVDPLDVSYVETHGTGTAVGDPLEVAAITKAYSKGRSEPIVIGSVKTNVGHTESVSGLTGIVKVLLSMKNEVIPKHLNLEKLNPAIDLESIPAKIPLEPVAWPKQAGKPRIAGVSSFGISGTDGHAIIQEPPTMKPSQLTDESAVRPLHIMKISARSPESLQDLLSLYEKSMGSSNLVGEFSDMAYSANIGRATFNHRAVIIAKDFKDARNSITIRSFKSAEIRSSDGQLCFLFPGEGSQYPKMGHTLYATSPVFREEFDKCDRFLVKQYSINIRQYLWGQSSHPGAEINPAIFHQTSSFCIEYCLAKLWSSWGVKPDYVIGHELGEYAAAVVAGALDFEDALVLIVERGRLGDNLQGTGLNEFSRVAQSVKRIQAGKDAPKYISTMEGKIVDLELIEANYWARHATAAVRYQDALNVAQLEGCSIFLEIGSNPTLLNNVEGRSVSLLPSIKPFEDEWATMLDSLAQLYLSPWKGDIDWKGFDWPYQRSRVPLPFYPFNRRSIWKELENVQLTVHPLLGRPAQTASSSKIFERGLTCKNPSFTQDHVIGNTVVFPGAGFLEMCLAGGNATVHGTSIEGSIGKPPGPIALRSLKIASPLALYDTGVCRLQTTVQLDKMGKEQAGVESYSVGVHRYITSSSGGLGDWISHATAKFIPVQETQPKASIDVDIPSIQSSWEKRDNTEFYEKLPEVGLRFGPKFRSLEMGWYSDHGMLASVKLPEDNDHGYLIHPIVADAMIQATMLWTSKDKLKMKLQVPVQIGEFTWLQGTSFPSCYVYCETSKEGQTICILLDGQGHHLAHMMDVDFVETTVKLVEGMLQQQSQAMPKLWSEVWKSVPGALQKSYDLAATRDIQLLHLTDDKRVYLAQKNDVGEYERGFYNNLTNLSRLYFLSAMYELGWEPKQMLAFTSEDLIQLLPQPKEHFKRIVRYFLRSVAGTGMLVAAAEEQDKYYFPGLPPTRTEINEGLKLVMGPEDSSRVEYKLVVKGGQNLSQVLRGNVDALELLFPEDSTQEDASQFYIALRLWIEDIVKMVITEFCDHAIAAGWDAYMGANPPGSPLPVIRVLEVGAGTGVNSKLVFDYLEGSGKPYEYYFTDISASFFNSAEKNFEKYMKNIVFKKFNMEEDPLAQGFCPKYFDLIVACEVLHIAKDIRKTLRNLDALLKPSGMFQIVETTVPDPRISVTFGLLEGYWQFEDTDFRPYHTTLTPEKWVEALRGIGCSEVVCTPAYNNVHSVITARSSAEDGDAKCRSFDKPQYSWLVFCSENSADLAELIQQKLVGVNRKVQIIKRPPTCSEASMKELTKSGFQLATKDTDRVEGVVYLWGLSNDGGRDQSQISLPLVSLVQEMLQCKVPPRLYVVTQGTSYVDEGEVTTPSAATLQGIIKTLSNETVGLHWSCLDLSPDNLPVDQVEEIFHELWWTEKGNRNIAFRDKNRLFAKLVNTKLSRHDPLPLPGGCDRFQLVLPKSRLISDLELGVLEHYSLNETEIEVEVKAVALNFRDIFVIIKPVKEFEDFNAVAIDYAGVVTKVGAKVAERKVGDRVIGLNLDKDVAMPSHVKVKERFVVPLPPHTPFEQGATLPVVLSTAIYCLLEVAKIKRGDTVLIHTASGGVGLCAIQLAKQVGANIIATAGSKRKRAYLRHLGIQHVFHSRTTEFGNQVLEVTNGRGVDIVLNSLTGEGFKEASLSALRKGGWFVEMSILNVWSREEMKELRPDASYEIVELFERAKTNTESFMGQLKQCVNGDHLVPIAYERFDAVNIREALYYLQKAKHIGKIVCRMPEIRVENSKILSTTPFFNDVSTYLVTGGLGGIGFEVVKWMLSSGAKHIAIASRSKPKPEIISQLAAWAKAGKHVEAFSVDVGDPDQCQQLFQELANPARGFPPLRGVMHAAGVLADAIMENQSWDKFKHTYNPKVNGTWNLHDLTKDLLLEHFVLFSSMTASFGTPGQANHAASNCFEDALAAYRRSNGLPATTINWGNWGEVGVATELDFPGIRPIPTVQGLLALKTFLKTQTSHLNVVNLDSCALAVKLIPNLKSFVDDKRLFGELKTTIIINSDDFWKDVDNCEDREGKLVVFKEFIKSTLKNILKMDQDEVIDDLAEFQSLGIDSLMMLEMKNGLQNILGSRMTLTANQLKDCNNTEVLANRLVDILEGEGDYTETVLPTMEELRDLIHEDSTLPEHIRPSVDMQGMSGIENVLLTGVTGVLGPYLLRDLSHRPNIKKIHCLIRKSGSVSPDGKASKAIKGGWPGRPS